MILFRKKNTETSIQIVLFILIFIVLVLAVFFRKYLNEDAEILFFSISVALITLLHKYMEGRINRKKLTAETNLAFVELVLIVLSSEGKLNEKNIKRLEKYFSKEYSSKTVKKIVAFAKKNFKKLYDYKKICKSLYSLSNPAKIRIIHKLFLFSADDGFISEEQKQIIFKIAKQLGLSSIHYKNIEKIFVKKEQQEKTEKKSNYWSQYNQKQYKKKAHTANKILTAYKILDISPTISNQLLKASFRQLAKQYHPDKWAGKDSLQRKKAKETFQELNNAYQIIKRSRNIK
jgi:DnaJ like chaperone protein